jgi:2,3-bisphosphoglycerate-independent phosphoglycerate mutase
LSTENETKKITTALLNNRTDNTVEMTITNVLTQHTVVITNKTNVHDMITDDQPREIAPTPTRAFRAAQAMTTEMVQHSNITKRNITISQQHLTSRITTEIHLKHHTTVVKNREIPKTIKRKDKIIKP